MSGKFFLLFIFFALLFPELFSAPPSVKTAPNFYSVATHPWFGLIGTRPQVYSGDEPHFLLMLHSMMREGDLKLMNNYQGVYRGSSEAGRKFIGTVLDPHFAYYINDRYTMWLEVYDYSGAYLNSEGLLTFPLKKGVPPEVAALPHRSWHPPALALMTSPFVYLLKDTDWVEAGVVFLTALVTFAGFMVYRYLLGHFLTNPMVINLIAGVTYLGTPLWHYSRTFFTENYIATFVVGFFALVLRRKDSFIFGFVVPGLLIGLAMTLKPTTLFFLLPVMIREVARFQSPFLRRARNILGLSIGPALFGVYFLIMNFLITGSAYRSYQQVEFGNFWDGFIGLIGSTEHGLFPYVPVAFLAFGGWIKLLKKNPLENIPLISGAVAYFLFFSTVSYWHGASCYGPRYLVPCMPIFLIGLVPVLNRFDKKGNWIISRTAVGLICLSVFINFLGVFPYFQFWDNHPFSIFWS